LLFLLFVLSFLPLECDAERGRDPRGSFHSVYGMVACAFIPYIFENIGGSVLDMSFQKVYFSLEKPNLDMLSSSSFYSSEKKRDRAAHPICCPIFFRHV
jgi:hypothetical protein